MTKIINPAEERAAAKDPNWAAIQQQIRASYAEVQDSHQGWPAKPR